MGGEPTFSSPPNEVSHYFLYIYIKRWSSFAGGRGPAFAPLTKCLFFFLLLIKSRRDTSLGRRGTILGRCKR